MTRAIAGERTDWASLVSLAIFVTALATVTHASCGCYGPRDVLPPCNAPGSGCDYPALARDAGADAQ